MACPVWAASDPPTREGRSPWKSYRVDRSRCHWPSRARRATSRHELRGYDEEAGEAGKILPSQLPAELPVAAHVLVGETRRLVQKIREALSPDGAPPVPPVPARHRPELEQDLSSYSRLFFGSERSSQACCVSLKRSSAPGLASGWCSLASLLYALRTSSEAPLPIRYHRTRSSGRPTSVPRTGTARTWTGFRPPPDACNLKPQR